MQKARENKKKKLNAALKENPVLCKILKTRISSGKPPLEEEQPLLLKTIVDIAMRGSAYRIMTGLWLISINIFPQHMQEFVSCLMAWVTKRLYHTLVQHI